MFLRKLQGNVSNHAVTLLLHWLIPIPSPSTFRLSQIGRAELHTQRFGLTVSFRRFPSSFYESYPMGGASTPTSLMPQLVQQWYRLNMMRLWNSKGSGNLLRINYVSLTNSHTRRGASVETDPPVVLSSIHSPTLGRVWYHAPWLQHCRRYRQCGLLLFDYLPW